MPNDEVVRSVCYFTETPDRTAVATVNNLGARLIDHGYEVQTRRVCCPFADPLALATRVTDGTIFLSVGRVALGQVRENLPRFYQADTVSFHIDLTAEPVDARCTEVLFELIRHRPSMTFNFAYVFHNASSSPYFPAAAYERTGFAIGLQPTDLSADCRSLDEWFQKLQGSWGRLYELFKDDPRFLGIDSSTAPLFEGTGSLVNFVKRLGLSFDQSVTTPMYSQITDFIKEKNPKPVGLCGLMLPCLEDFELAAEYEDGRFSIERNLFLSLQSGVGIDTYPMGIDEEPARVVQILRLVQELAKRYRKPLSVRLVSDGKARIGERTDFQNRYLKDVVVRKL